MRQDSAIAVMKTRRSKAGKLLKNVKSLKMRQSRRRKTQMQDGRKKVMKHINRYKDHLKCDAEIKPITNYGVTDAALHESQHCTDLLDENDEVPIFVIRRKKEKPTREEP